MNLEFLGHAAVLLTSGDARLLVDPYESPAFGGAFRYRSLADVAADWVVCSHHHPDHSATHAVPHATVVYAGEAGPFRIERFSVPHDEYGGARKGGEVDILRIAAENAVIVHLSDVGCSPPSGSEADELIGSLAGADLLLVPVGGNFTIGAAQAWEWCSRLGPRVIVPIHYRTDACSLPVLGPETFLSWTMEWKARISGPISVQKGEAGCVLLAPTKA